MSIWVKKQIIINSLLERLSYSYAFFHIAYLYIWCVGRLAIPF